MKRLSQQEREPIDQWITKQEVLQRTGATESQLQRWHTRIFAYSNRQLVRRQGIGRGSITLYHHICIPIAQRLLDLKTSAQASVRGSVQRDFRFWRWQLWLDGYPINVKRDCIEAMRDIEEAASDVSALPSYEGRDTLGLVEELIRYVGTPEQGSLTEHIYRRTPHEADRHSLLVWLLYFGLGVKPLVGWNDVVDAEDPLDLMSPPNDHPYPTIGQLFANAIGAPKEWAQAAPWNDDMSLGTIRQVLEQASEDEWQQVREDWQPVVRLIPYIPLLEKALEKGARTRTVPLGALTKLYHEAYERAVMTSLMIYTRRINMGDDLDQILAALEGLAVALGAAQEVMEAAGTSSVAPVFPGAGSATN